MNKYKQMRFIFLLSFFLSSIFMYAQTVSPHRCGTVNLPLNERNTLEKMMRAIMSKQIPAKKIAEGDGNLKVANAGTTCIPIKIHDIRDGSGNGAVDMTALNKDLANLNYHFQTSNIEFYFCGTIDAQNNATHYDFLTTNESALLSAIPSVTNAFNLYLVNSIDAGSGIAGYAYFPFNLLLSTVCIMDKDALAIDDNGTIVHEFGHHFNLLHTFEDTENGNTDPNAENVPRSGAGSNCTTKGDFLCDTHADPNDGLYTGCTYTGGGMDILGNTYTPPMDNIMSYYPNQCGGFFTAGQTSRIMAALPIRQGHSAYTLNCAATAVTAASGLTAVQVGSVVNLNWTDNAANELGYLIERSTTSTSAGFSPIPMGGVAANTTTFSDNTVVSNTTYWYRIKASNGNCNTYSNVATVTTGFIYCTPTYSNAPYCSNATISNVTFTGNTTINNTTTCAAPAYTDYSSTISADVTAGITYNFSVTMSSNFNRYVQVFVDFNRDGDFLDANEKVLPDNTPMPFFTYNGSMLIPAAAVNGATIMRVIIRNQTATINTACETNMTFGEAEDYGLVISGGALPVELISFNGKEENGNVVLIWNTIRESGKNYFELEKSADGQNFYTIKTIEAAAKDQYGFVDTDPWIGSNLYRLKTISVGEEDSYSEIVSVNVSATEGVIVVSPNPTSANMIVEVKYNPEASFSCQLKDITGKIIISENEVLPSGSGKRELLMQALPAGVYLLQVTTGTSTHSHRVVKQ